MKCPFCDFKTVDDEQGKKIILQHLEFDCTGQELPDLTKSSMFHRPISIFDD
jgi:hypothetical protein